MKEIIIYFIDLEMTCWMEDNRPTYIFEIDQVKLVSFLSLAVARLSAKFYV